LLKRYRTDGEAGIAHGTRGKPSPRRLEANTRDLIVALARTTYVDHNDCHLTQKLQGAPYRLAVSRTTARKVRRAAGLGSPRKRRAPRHRQRPERRPRPGMLLQADGSRHDWLERRGPWLTWVAYLDDATNQVPWARFRGDEDAAAAQNTVRKTRYTTPGLIEFSCWLTDHTASSTDLRRFAYGIASPRWLISTSYRS
jgi:hypothetical protein